MPTNRRRLLNVNYTGQPTKLGNILAITSAVFFGAWKFGIGHSRGKVSTHITILISVAATGAVYILLGMLSKELFFDNKDIIPGIIGGSCNYAGSVSMLKAFERSKMGVVTGIGSTVCLVPFLYSIIIGELLSGRDLIGVVLFILGLTLFCTQGKNPGDGGLVSRTAILYSFAAALFWGFGIVVLDIGTHESLIGTLLISLLPQILFASIKLSTEKKHYSGPDYSSFTLLIFSGIAVAVANIAFYTAANEGDIGLITVIRSLNPLITILLAQIFLRERMTRAEMAALFIVLAGTVLVVS